VKRHPALVPFSRDHHHGLVQARWLRLAADGDEKERRAAATAFVEFFERETERHFAEEEERVFPLAAGNPVVAGALRQHDQLRRTVRRLRREHDAGLLRATADLLSDNIRLEERRLFPVVEARLPDPQKP
jgi:hemerythrin